VTKVRHCIEIQTNLVIWDDQVQRRISRAADNARQQAGSTQEVALEVKELTAQNANIADSTHDSQGFSIKLLKNSEDRDNLMDTLSTTFYGDVRDKSKAA